MSILRAPKSRWSVPVAHWMNFQAASFFLEKLDMASDQIQTLAVGLPAAAGLAAKAA